MKATLRHFAIDRSEVRVVNLRTDDLWLAKCRATREFRGACPDYTICIIGEKTPANPDGLVAMRQVGYRHWHDREILDSAL